MSVKVTISLPDGLLPQIDAYAEKMSLNRSAAIAMMTSEYMRGLSAVDAVSKLAGMMEQYQRHGTLPTDAELNEVEEQVKPLPLSSKKSRKKKTG